MNNETEQALSRRLRLLGNEALRLAGEIDPKRAEFDRPTRRKSALRDQDMWLVLAQEQYEHRRQRASVFPGAIFGEPAWDMLLDLYMSEKRGERISVSAACIGSACPPTTALRWIKELETIGFISREKDGADARRTFLYLTQNAYERMTTYFASISQVGFRAAA